MNNKLEIGIKILYFFLIYLAAQIIFIILVDTVSGHVTNHNGNYKVLGLIILLIVSLQIIINRIKKDEIKK